MKILVLSDTHDHIWNLQKVIDATKGKVEAAIHCGDWCAPFAARVVATIGVPIYTVLGNADNDQFGLQSKGGDSISWLRLGEEVGEIELGGKKLAYVHYTKVARLLAGSGRYDAVFFGHNHQASNESVGQTLLLNPGAVCGIQNDESGFPVSGIASYALYDTDSNTAEIVEL